MERDPEATDPEAAARTQLGRITAELEAIQFRLLGVHTSLAAPSREGLPLAGPRHTEKAEEILVTIECVLVDRIGPALRALQEVVQEEPGRENGEAGPDDPASVG